MNKLGSWLYTKFFGVYVGQDQFGNKYYEGKKHSRTFGRKPRWVYYNGEPEPTKVSSKYFNWLHFQTDIFPESSKHKYDWEIEHEINLTGTSKAYYPKGHILSGAKRDKAIGDYESWKPE